jgi:hypothetical protein
MSADSTPQPTPTQPWPEDDPLGRIKGETAKHHRALNDYAQLGAGRSLTKLLDHWKHQDRPEPAPTRQLRTLKTWSAKYHWQARLAAWTAHRTAEERAIWAERERAARLRNWETAEAAQTLVLEALIEQAPRLIRSSRREVRQPDGSVREIVTIGLDATALARLGDYGLKVQEAALQTQRQAAGTEDDPIHTVGLSLGEWRAQQAERRAAALETLAEFGEGRGARGEE